MCTQVQLRIMALFCVMLISFGLFIECLPLYEGCPIGFDRKYQASSTNRFLRFMSIDMTYDIISYDDVYEQGLLAGQVLSTCGSDAYRADTFHHGGA